MGFSFLVKTEYNLIMIKRKVLIFIALAILILIGILGTIFWLKSSSPALQTNTVSKPSTTPSQNIPQVEKFDVPILMYHYIRNAEGEDQLGKNLSVSPENFEAQIKWLKDDHYQTIKLQDLADSNRTELSRVYFKKKKPIILTFDDGYEDAYTQAYPVLKKYGFIGTFFIITEYTGRENRLTHTQIDEMTKSGMEFGSHSLTHPDLTKISLEDAKSQIVNSKGDWLTFCYPSGKYNSDIINLIKDAGYLAAVTTKIGIANEKSNLFELRRVRVENVSPQVLMDKISYAYESGQY